jgi:hypothetical protein
MDSFKELSFRGYRIRYNDAHDVAAMIESYVLNVYRIEKLSMEVS